MKGKNKAFFCGWAITLSGAAVTFLGYLLLLSKDSAVLAALSVITGVAMMYFGARISQGTRVKHSPTPQEAKDNIGSTKG